jgi:hypothetical protein
MFVQPRHRLSAAQFTGENTCAVTEFLGEHGYHGIRAFTRHDGVACLSVSYRSGAHAGLDEWVGATVTGGSWLLIIEHGLRVLTADEFTAEFEPAGAFQTDDSLTVSG